MHGGAGYAIMLASTFDEEVAVTALYCDTHVRGVDEFTFRFFNFRRTSALTQIIGRGEFLHVFRFRFNQHRTARIGKDNSPVSAVRLV